MLVEQAVFGSARTRRMCGYQLVARSAGLRDELARKLLPWGPSHGSLASREPDFSCLGFFPLVDSWYGVARSVCGGPEYSNRGALQVVTSILVVGREQLAGYDNNALTLARVAYALGNLRLIASLIEKLPPIELPDSAPLGMDAAAPAGDDTHYAREAVRLVSSGRRAALIGLAEPLLVLGEILRLTPADRRLHLSFTTGLKPTVHRPFALHFLSSADSALRRQLASLAIAGVDASSSFQSGLHGVGR